MALTLNNIATLSVLNTLGSISSALIVSNQRLSTGYRVNSAADDPAGIIAVANFDRRIAEIDAAARNGARINSVIDTADGAMAQIASMLGTIQTKALAAAGSTTTAEERAAYQAEIDTAIDSIDALIATTTFNDTHLLDGGLSYTTSGIDSTKLADVRVNSANGSVSLDVDVVSAAEKGSISYSNGVLVDDVTFTITGPDGSYEFTFATGSDPDTDIKTAINAVSDTLGVEASFGAGTLTLSTSEYGSSKIVSINVTEGTFVMDGATTSDSGVDATVTVDNQTTITDGLKVNFSANSTSVKFSLKESFGNVGGGSTSFSITGGGANFALDANPINQVKIGMASIRSSYLGNDDLGYLNSIKSGGANALSSGNYYQAANIASAASQMISTERARFGAVQTYTVNATLSSLSSTKTALSSARSSIMDIDYAKETANKSRLQVLMQASIAILASLNSNTQNILTLLSR